MKQSGFTLAETLITLVIIGVIAALTVPLIMERYNKHVVEVRLKKFYSNINQAIRKSEIDNGDKRYWTDIGNGFEQDENGTNITDKPLAKAWYDEYLAPYIITTQVSVDRDTGKVVSYYPDGSLSLISASGIAFYPKAKDYKGAIDTTESGKKYFSFLFEPKNNNITHVYHYNKGIEPYAYKWDGTREMLLNDTNFGCNNTELRFSRAYCTMLIALNNWKIPNDYPLSF